MHQMNIFLFISTVKQFKVEAVQNEKFGETLIDAESAAFTSESALCAGGNANRVKAHIRVKISSF